MAHRTNITQVLQSINLDDLPETVRDPICGKELKRKGCHHVLFRGDQTYYFCSKECENKFISSSSSVSKVA